ncbi:hypothetical protein BaRGS_00033385 [Batillaria attramentaria]|uniref:Uncharacterized protein n=1 Tax=Batillaria attramentaria TaxID=370345 RepID=A0ABD0JLL4_9CAEN
MGLTAVPMFQHTQREAHGTRRHSRLHDPNVQLHLGSTHHTSGLFCQPVSRLPTSTQTLDDLPAPPAESHGFCQSHPAQCVSPLRRAGKLLKKFSLIVRVLEMSTLLGS